MKENSLAKSGSTLFILNMAASVLNYLCQLIMARTLSVTAFGTVNTIFSFMLIVAVPGTTLTMIVARYYAGAGENASLIEKYSYIRTLLKKVSALTGTVFLAFLILTVPLRRFLVINDPVVLALAFFLAAFGFYQPLYSGVFIGNKKFVLVGLYSLLIPAYKIISVVMARVSTDKDMGRLYIILSVMALGTVGTALIGHWKTFSITGKTAMPKKGEAARVFKKDDLYALLLNICLMVYMNIDLLFVRYFGSDNESGLYSAVLLFGRIVYYFSTTLGTMLLPVSANKNITEQARLRNLNNALLLLIIFSILCIVPINVGKTLFIRMLFGPEYLTAVPYIKYVSIISVALSICTVLANYLVGIGKSKFAATVMLFTNIVIILYACVIRNIAYILGVIGVFGIVGAGLIYWFCIPQKKNIA